MEHTSFVPGNREDCKGSVSGGGKMLSVLISILMGNSNYSPTSYGEVKQANGFLISREAGVDAKDAVD